MTKLIHVEHEPNHDATELHVNPDTESLDISSYVHQNLLFLEKIDGNVYSNEICNVIGGTHIFFCFGET